jgi:hypothetical protein
MIPAGLWTYWDQSEELRWASGGGNVKGAGGTIDGRPRAGYRIGLLEDYVGCGPGQGYGIGTGKDL